MPNGLFISIEGIEGAGKSTALTFIQAYLTKAQLPVIITREPGGTLLAEKIRQLILHAQDETVTSDTELLLLFAARSQHLKHVILPALAQGKWVISDRFIDASYAYQGGGRGIDVDKIKLLDQWISKAFYPQLTLLLDISPEAGFIRTAQRGTAKDRIEQEKMDFFSRVREMYLKRAQEFPHRIKIIDASVSLAEVKTQIQYALDEFMKRQR